MPLDDPSSPTEQGDLASNTTPEASPPPSGETRGLSTRVISAVVLAIPAIFFVLIGNWAFAGMVAIGLVICMIELHRLAQQQGIRVQALWSYIAAGALPLLTQAVPGNDAPVIAGLVGLLLAMGAMTSLLWQPQRQAVIDWAVTLAFSVYLIGPGLACIALRDGPMGLSWLMMAFVTTWSCDSGAYLVGRSYGKTPFFQRISPRKTREGALGGLLIGMAGGAAVGLLMGVPLDPLVMLLCTATIAAAAQAGDLVESLLKRQAHVKDAGQLIPGHGGLLDRVDSLLFAVVVTLMWRLITGLIGS